MFGLQITSTGFRCTCFLNSGHNQKTAKLHITGLYMLRRLSAARATKKPSRAYALCGFFLRHIFAIKELLRNSFIATAKTSYTAETLYAINF
jgi:hypothetical protein